MLGVRILLTGVSGFAGAALLPRLLEQGHDVRALARDRTRVERALAHTDTVNLTDFELIIGDTVAGTGVSAAMRDVEVAYYLIHSMEPSSDRSGRATFPARERASADTFAQTARAAGVRRIVYLGGLLPGDSHTSTHLSSRHVVERILLEAVPDSLALRASIVIGARSRSFRFLVRLVERLPVLTLPAWRNYRTQPIDERDIVDLLASSASVASVAGRTLDVGGPDVLSYGEMVERIADLMLLRRPSVGLGITATPLAARLAAMLTDEHPELVLPLMEGLTGDLLPADHEAPNILDVKLHSFDSAVEHALYEWEKMEPLAAR
ncbi:MAG: NAD-dependent epimerase/dehydratase family protein [Solirubrobacteraceae bacterium]